MRGVIDRVDVDPGDSGRAIVRDYKSGSARQRASGRALGVRRPAPGGAVHDRRAPICSASSRWPACTSRSAAVTCVRAACSSRMRRWAREVVDRDGRTAEELEEVLRDAARAGGGAGGAAAQRRARAVPADLLARRLPLPGDLPQPMIALDAAPDGPAGPPSSSTRSSVARASCCSTPARAAARPRCWSSGSRAPCSRTGSMSRRSSRSRSPTRPPPSCVSGSAGGCASSAPTRGRASHRGRVHLDHPRLLRPGPARAHALAAGLDPPSPCSISRRRSVSPTPPSTTRSRSSPATSAGGVELIAAYTPPERCAARSSGPTASCAPAARPSPELPPLPRRARSRGEPRTELLARRRGRGARSSASVASPERQGPAGARAARAPAGARLAAEPWPAGRSTAWASRVATGPRCARRSASPTPRRSRAFRTRVRVRPRRARAPPARRPARALRRGATPSASARLRASTSRTSS